MSKVGFIQRKTYKNIEKYLSSYGDYIVRLARKTIKKKAPGGSGRLSRALKYRINFRRSEWVVGFTSNRYGDFVEKGVRGVGGVVAKGRSGSKRNWMGYRTYIDTNGKRRMSPNKFKGKRPPTQSLMPWIMKNGISLKKGQTLKGLAHAISIGIFRKGLPGISFFSQNIAATKGQFKRKLAENFAKDIEAGVMTHGFKVKI